MEFKAQDGTIVELERWGWLITYSDKRTHHQFDFINQTYNNYHSIEKNAVESLTMVNFETGKQHTIQIPARAEVIHYYDNIIQQRQNASPTHYRIYCYGYELNGEKHIWNILPTDLIVQGVINGMEIL